VLKIKLNYEQHFLVKNPSEKTFTVASIAYDLFVNGKLIGVGSYSTADIAMPGRAAFYPGSEIPLKNIFLLVLDDTNSQEYQSIIEGESLQYSVKGIVTVETAWSLLEKEFESAKQKEINQKIADRKEAEKSKQIYEELIRSKFDPTIVASAKKNIPEMQTLPRELLQECRKVKSYSDFVTFELAAEIMGDELVGVIDGINVALTLLESEGYNEHPEVGPLIKETRDLAFDMGLCINDLLIRYG